MAVKVVIAGLAVDPDKEAPIVVLKEVEGDRVLPIVIGFTEARAIAIKLENIDFPRPLTHDLLASVIEKLGGKLEKVEVCDLVDNTFYALLHIRVGDKVVTIDARPSDSIALALRTGADITVNEKVFEKTFVGKKTESEGEMWKEILESLDDEDFGKYKV